jgi:hypothetical protein
MTTRPASDPTPATETGHTLKRRGLLAAAWTAVAAFVLRQTTRPAEAANGDNVVLGTVNNETAGTNIINSTANNFALAANCVGGSGTGLIVNGGRFGVNASGGNSPQGGASSAGVFGQTNDGVSFGLWGLNSAAAGVGVRGEAFNGPGIGVQGVGNGSTDNAIGVSGLIPSTSTINAIGVYGLNLSSYAGPGPGAGGFGLYGLSGKGHGLVGATAAAGAAAVVGATNGVAGAFAAAFYGPAIVSGNFTVFGAKSAAVPLPDGTRRRMYCMESPESWFEDFGKGQLDCGRADVTIDPQFAAVAALDDYHVFLTDYGGRTHLSVTRQSPTGFSVETDDPTSETRFSWRVVAKRKDIAGPRFERVDAPAEPVLPPIPESAQAERQPTTPAPADRTAGSGNPISRAAAAPRRAM